MPVPRNVAMGLLVALRLYLEPENRDYKKTTKIFLKYQDYDFFFSINKGFSFLYTALALLLSLNFLDISLHIACFVLN